MKAVLIIEDNAASMEMLAKITNEVDPEIVVHRAVNQNEAYASAMRISIDLFLIDIMLDPKNPGDVSGMRFANRIRMVERYKYVPMIFITALEDADCTPTAICTVIIIWKSLTMPKRPGR